MYGTEKVSLALTQRQGRQFGVHILPAFAAGITETAGKQLHEMRVHTMAWADDYDDDDDGNYTENDHDDVAVQGSLGAGASSGCGWGSERGDRI